MTHIQESFSMKKNTKNCSFWKDNTVILRTIRYIQIICIDKIKLPLTLFLFIKISNRKIRKIITKITKYKKNQAFDFFNFLKYLKSTRRVYTQKYRVLLN